MIEITTANLLHMMRSEKKVINLKPLCELADVPYDATVKRLQRGSNVPKSYLIKLSKALYRSFGDETILRHL